MASGVRFLSYLLCFFPAYHGVELPLFAQASPPPATPTSKHWHLDQFRVRLVIDIDPIVAPDVAHDFQDQAGEQLLSTLGAIIHSVEVVKPGDINKSSQVVASQTAESAQTPEAGGNTPTDNSSPQVATNVSGESPPSPPASASQSAANDWDKQYDIRLTEEFPNYTLAVTEHDLRSGTTGPTIKAYARNKTELHLAFSRALMEAFRPLVKVKDVLQVELSADIRAGLLSFGDGRVPLIEPGDIFIPSIYESSFTGEARTAPIPWAFVRCREVDGAVLKGEVFAASMNSLAMRRSGRINIMLTKISAPGGTTRLKLVDQLDANRPLVGYEIQKRRADDKERSVVGFTNRQGEIDISGGPGEVVILFVRHGEALLARFPMLPGLEPTLVAKARNDEERLKVEGYLMGIQDEIVDLVAQRELLLARARAAMTKGQVEEARQHLDGILVLRPASSLMLEVDRREAEDQKAAASEQQAEAVKRQVHRMYEDTRRLINRSLSNESITLAERELKEARRAQNSKPLDE